MRLHLQEVSRQVTPGAHAVLVLDGAGWHGLAALGELPRNLTLLPLPRHSPELNPCMDGPRPARVFVTWRAFSVRVAHVYPASSAA
jgi:hypothetical protein